MNSPQDLAAVGERFNLSRWFAVVAFLSIASLAVAAGAMLDWFVSSRMIQQEAALTREFVDSMLTVEAPLQAYVASPSPEKESAMAVSFHRVARMPDVLRVNLYSRERVILWSSDAAVIGKRYDVNEDLDRALNGEVMARRDEHHDSHTGKAEHEDLRERDQMFVEIYVPITNPDGSQIVGAFEFYKRPMALNKVLEQLRTFIVVGAIVSAALLYLALMGLVNRADRLIRSQHRLIVDQATLAALGEMSGAVAHGIRNPLASIRSSAELIPDAEPARAQEAAQDIIAQTDRLEDWVRELLSYTQPLDDASSAVQVDTVVHSCVDDFQRDFTQRNISLDALVAPDLPKVRADARLLGQILRSVLANAMEAVGQDGHVLVKALRRPGGDGVTLEVSDSGRGLTPEQLAKVGQPFYTTKPRGLGVGLAMARRVLQRHGGALEIHSKPGQGTVVRLHLGPTPA